MGTTKPSMDNGMMRITYMAAVVKSHLLVIFAVYQGSSYCRPTSNIVTMLHVNQLKLCSVHTRKCETYLINIWHWRLDWIYCLDSTSFKEYIFRSITRSFVIYSLQGIEHGLIDSRPTVFFVRRYRCVHSLFCETLSLRPSICLDFSGQARSRSHVAHCVFCWWRLSFDIATSRNDRLAMILNHIC